MKFKNSLLFLLVLTPAIFYAQSFYVDGVTGNNNNNGLTLATAWKTIQKACNSATPGSTVYIRGGTYTENLWMNVTGTVGNYITFTHYAAENVVVDGGSTGVQTELLNISGPDYIKIIGLEFAHATGQFSLAIAIRDGSDYIEIQNCVIHDIHFSNNPSDPVDCLNSDPNANGLIVYNENATDACTNILIQDNTIYNCRTGCSEALTINGNVDGFTIAGNTVHDIANIGIDAAGGYGVCPDPAKDAARNGVISGNTTYNCVSLFAVSAGIYVDGGKDILIEKNTSYENGRGYEIGCEQLGKSASGIILRDNVSYHNKEAGIGIGGYDYPNSTGKVVNCQVRNNTFYDDAYTNNGNGELFIEYTENCTISQNIFYATNPMKRVLTAELNSIGLALDYNLYYHSSGAAFISIDWNGTPYNYNNYQSGTGQDAHSPFSNPVFFNAALHNFALQNTSPAINAGLPGFIPSAGETDFVGAARLMGTRIDIGAYENQVVLPVEYAQPLTAQVEGPDILLRWSVAWSINHQYFEIERSADGYTFEKIGENDSPLHHTAETAFAFKDLTPLKGIGYYRIKQVDNDERVSFSTIVSAEMEPQQVLISPNPSNGLFRIEAANLPAYCLITDQIGQHFPLIEVLSDGEIHVENFVPGIYWVQLFFKDNFVPVICKVEIQ